jgi:flagellar basal-body rod modification protein FlgD
MAVSEILSTNAASNYVPAAERVTKKTLGQQDFFKLLAVQFASQDPLKPMEDTSFIAQMANFTALENSTQLSKAFDRFSTGQGFASAQNLLGRNVTLQDPSDREVTGVVTAVHSDGSDTMITVNGADYAVGSVRRVELPPTETNPPVTSGN